jgi:hypothetical protein
MSLLTIPASTGLLKSKLINATAAKQRLGVGASCRVAFAQEGERQTVTVFTRCRLDTHEERKKIA